MLYYGVIIRFLSSTSSTIRGILYLTYPHFYLLFLHFSRNTNGGLVWTRSVVD